MQNQYPIHNLSALVMELLQSYAKPSIKQNSLCTIYSNMHVFQSFIAVKYLHNTGGNEHDCHH